MGNPFGDGAQGQKPAAIHPFYSASSWIEGAALEQLRLVAALPGMHAVAAFPDLHPGKYGPVGCAMLSGRLYPQLIGNDIGCGMSLFHLDLPCRRLRPEKAAQRLRGLEGAWGGNAGARLEEAGLPAGNFALSLGTIGGGNHFCEVQTVEEILDPDAARAAEIARDDLLLLVHSGSRGLGAEVFTSLTDAFADGLPPDSPAAAAYMDHHAMAVRWAGLNRRIIAERAAELLRSDIRLIADAPHNLVEPCEGLLLHRKGAARADRGLAPLAGSRDTMSYLMHATDADPASLSSLAHGSGRKYDRRSMTGRAGRTRSEREDLTRTSFGGRVICDDRQLLIEEAPLAYKNPRQVRDDLVMAGLATCIAAMKPLITFKKARTPDGQQGGRNARVRDKRRGGRRER